MKEQLPENKSKIWRVPKLKDLEILKATSVDHVYARHWHGTYVVEIVEAGRNGFYCEGTRYEAPAGNIIIINPFQVHTGYPLGDAPLMYRSMYPSIELMRDLTSGISGQYNGFPEFPAPVIHDPIAAKQLANLHLHIEANSDGLEIESLFVSVVSTLIATHSSTKVATHAIQAEHSGVRRTRDYLCQHYAKEVTLENLAQVSGLSSFHLLRSFRKAYGMPPFAFLMNLRIENARRLLRKGWDISDVAQETGFCDQSHLNRNFIRITGVTPGKYRAISSKKSFRQHANLSL